MPNECGGDRLDLAANSRHDEYVKKIPLEDEFNDIIGKAQRGLDLSDAELAQRAGISVEELQKVKNGEFLESAVRKLAPALGLGVQPLIALGKREWYPKDPGSLAGLVSFNTAYGTMTVNSYLVWDPKSGNAVCVDTGADASGMLQFAAQRELRVQLVLLTHTHPDHIADLERLTRATEAKAFVSKLEAFSGAETFEAGYEVNVVPLP